MDSNRVSQTEAPFLSRTVSHKPSMPIEIPKQRRDMLAPAGNALKTRPMSPDMIFEMSPDSDTASFSLLTESPLLYAFPEVNAPRISNLRRSCLDTTMPAPQPSNSLVSRPQWPRKPLAPVKRVTDENRGRTIQPHPAPLKIDGFTPGRASQDRAFSPARARGRRLTPAQTRRSSLSVPYQHRPVLRAAQDLTVPSPSNEKYIYHPVEQEKTVEIHHYSPTVASLRVSLHS